MGIQERKDREKDVMRRIILDAAIDLFASEGYENVSIRKIAEKIEYSPASIYNYFEDKGSILFELLNDGFDKLYEKQLAVQHIVDTVERFQAHGRAYLDFAREYPHYYNLMFIMHQPMEKIKRFVGARCTSQVAVKRACAQWLKVLSRGSLSLPNRGPNRAFGAMFRHIHLGVIQRARITYAKE